MSSMTPVERSTSASAEGQALSRTKVLRSWLMSWEIYLIVAAAGWLRLYGIQTTEFDDDQAAVFRMAYNAVIHGHFVATSNIASIHIYNPPAIIYFFMLPAAFSANPLWGAVMVGVLMTLSVLLTYIFMRRYYGRIAATVAALLYAVAARPIFYSRFIWNQNLLPILTILFLFTLFWGVVERKKGWLAPAIFLLGMLVQLHASGIMMAFPLGVALLLSPRTLRWRDLLLGCVALFISYFPYLLWELSTNFIDVRTLLAVTKQPVFIDNKAWIFYRLFLSPYDYDNIPDKHTLLGSLVPILSWTRGAMTVLVGGGAIASLIAVFWSRLIKPLGTEQEHTKQTTWHRITNYLRLLRANSYRCGLLVLLVWQIVPILILTRHSIGLYAHYIIILMPGPFILVGLFVMRSNEWLRWRQLWTAILRACLFVLTGLLIVAQFAGSTASVLDAVHGNFNDMVLSHPYYNDLDSLQNALHQADQVAQHYHYTHVYVSSDPATQAALHYLSQQMHTPTTVFDSARCAVLPGVANGPAVMLIGPYSPFTETLVQHFASATLVATPKRLSGSPFKLYIVQPLAREAGGTSFSSDLQLLGSSAHPFTFNGRSWNVTQWRFLRTAQPSYQKVYWYNIAQYSNVTATQSEAQGLCGFTAMQAGDTLLASLEQTGTQKQPLTLKVEVFTDNPYTLTYGPITLDTYKEVPSRRQFLKTMNGKETLTLSLAAS